MSTGHQLLTSREFEQLTFERPTELVRGEIVEYEMPGSPHGSVCAAIIILLGIWNRATKSGCILANDSFVRTERDPDSVRGPDAAYIHRDRLPDGKFTPGALEVPPDLVVEVLSPSDRWSDVFDKIEEFLTCGVREVWVIDPEKRSMSIHQAGHSPLRIVESETLTRPDLLPGFSCQVAEFFADI